MPERDARAADTTGVADRSVGAPVDAPASGRIRLAGIARYATALAERACAAAMHAAARGGMRVSCAKGCGACCRRVVPISIPEAFLLADLVERLARDRRSEVLERFEAAESRLRAAGLEGAPLLSRAKEYFRLGVPCPFLEPDESCGIHPDRPTACREHIVYSAPHLCREDPPSTIDFVPVPVRVSECLASLAAELVGGAPSMIPLVYALDWVGVHADYGMREWDAGTVCARLQQLATESGGVRR